MQQQVSNLEKEVQLSNRQNTGSDSTDSTALTPTSDARSTVENHPTSPAVASDLSKSTSTAEPPSPGGGQLSGQTRNDQQQRAYREGANSPSSSMDWSLPYLSRYLWPPGPQQQQQQQHPIVPAPNLFSFAQDRVSSAYSDASLSPGAAEDRLIQYQPMPANGFSLPHMHLTYQDLCNQKSVVREFLVSSCSERC